MSNLTETHKPAAAGPHSRASKWVSKLDYLLYQRTVLVLALFCFLGVVSILWHLTRLSSDLVESATLQNVTRYSEALVEFRALYTSEVVARVKDHGVEVTHDYTNKEGAIPLPATLSLILGEHIGQKGSGVQVRLYSPYPFPWRQQTGGGLQDGFAEMAWASLQQHPDQAFYGFESFKGRRVLRYATADLMSSECVQCHNSHPDTPKKDWQTGDMRGVLEIILPVDQIDAEISTELHGTFALIGGLSLLGLLGLSLLGLVIGRFRRISEDLEQQVQERTTDLEVTNEQLREEVVERRQVEAALKLQSTIVQNMAEGVCLIKDESYTIVYANPRFEEMFGYDLGELNGKSITTLNYDDPNVRVGEVSVQIDQALKEQGELFTEVHNVKKDGTPFWCSVHIVGLEHPEYGKTWIAVQEDITERKQAQLALLQSTRLVALGQMAAGMAHELNQPLTALSTTAEGILLRQEEGMELAPERLQEMMRHIMGLVERMAGIIQHLRTFSRDTSQESDSSLTINEIVQSALQLVQSQLESDKIDLELDLGEGLPVVLGHSSSLEQVMLNLLTNARDAMNQKEEGSDWKKRISIRTRYDTEEERVLVEVEDQGTGIRTEDQSRLFDPFFTTKAPDKGTGLGLSLSYAIVKNHGGDIEWQSQEGAGALFRVCLPAAEKV